ncbi:MAG: hypothetical protein V3U75_10845 [Methylococcaceae bacterium]
MNKLDPVRDRIISGIIKGLKDPDGREESRSKFNPEQLGFVDTYPALVTCNTPEEISEMERFMVETLIQLEE